MDSLTQIAMDCLLARHPVATTTEERDVQREEEVLSSAKLDEVAELMT